MAEHDDPPVNPESLRLARLRRHLRQRDIAIRLDIAPQRISDFEQGLRSPTPEQTVILTRILGLQICAHSPEVA